MGAGVNPMDLSEPSPANRQAPNTNRARRKPSNNECFKSRVRQNKRGNVWNKSPPSPLFPFFVSGLLSHQAALRPAWKQTPLLSVAWSQGRVFLFRCEPAVLGTSIAWMDKPADLRIMELSQLEKTFKIIQCNPLNHHWPLSFLPFVFKNSTLCSYKLWGIPHIICRPFGDIISFCWFWTPHLMDGGFSLEKWPSTATFLPSWMFSVHSSLFLTQM